MNSLRYPALLLLAALIASPTLARDMRGTPSGVPGVSVEQLSPDYWIARQPRSRKQRLERLLAHVHCSGRLATAQSFHVEERDGGPLAIRQLRHRLLDRATLLLGDQFLDRPLFIRSNIAGILDRQVRTGVPLRSLVGRVAAHEIGHLLLGRNSHSPHGLMRAGWNVKEIHQSLWEFSDKDVVRIHERARQRQAVRLASS